VTGYSNFVNAVADLLIILETITDATSATPSTDPNFNTILPRAIEYAEGRMYRELDLIQTTSSQTTTTTAATRVATIPAGLIVVNSLNVITPAGKAPDDVGATRVPVIRTSIEGLNVFWPQGTVSDASGIPKWWADKDQTTAFLAPAPNGTYTLEFYGIVRPVALSASNTNTILTTYIPDVFLACSMVFFAGYQRDYGAMSDDPKLAQSWEQQYQSLKSSAVEEIARAKQMSAQWQPFSNTTKATPPRQ
jgi:hypothetical protein